MKKVNIENLIRLIAKKNENSVCIGFCYQPVSPNKRKTEQKENER